MSSKVNNKAAWGNLPNVLEQRLLVVLFRAERRLLFSEILDLANKRGLFNTPMNLASINNKGLVSQDSSLKYGLTSAGLALTTVGVQYHLFADAQKETFSPQSPSIPTGQELKDDVGREQKTPTQQPSPTTKAPQATAPKPQSSPAVTEAVVAPAPVAVVPVASSAGGTRANVTPLRPIVTEVTPNPLAITGPVIQQQHQPKPQSVAAVSTPKPAVKPAALPPPVRRVPPPPPTRYRK